MVAIISVTIAFLYWGETREPSETTVRQGAVLCLSCKKAECRLNARLFDL